MAKQKKGKVVKMLSPENYIRQKARSLPIHECWISKNWKRDKMASIIVSRKHTNGNLTMGMFLVDINCLGIKDTFYMFNVSPFDYQDYIKQYNENLDFGDNWEHIITLEKIIPEITRTPGCTDGRGTTPPEDCGGFPGYENLKQIMTNKKHPEYNDMAEWLGLEGDEGWEADDFDLQDMQATLRDAYADE